MIRQDTRRFLKAAGALAAGLILVACGKQEPPAPAATAASEPASAAAPAPAKVYTVGTDAAYAPFEFQNEKGEVRCSTDTEGSVRHEEGGWFAEDARITVDGSEQWEFLPDPKGRMRDFVGGFPITAQQEGRWRRVGDTRVPDRWMAWGETDRRNGSARNVRGGPL